MDRRITSVFAAFVLAATATPFVLNPLAAQTSNPANADAVDPVDTVYHTGALPEEPEVERRRSIVPHHRAFLPITVDLSSRMPAVGNQGHSMSCVAWATAYAARSYYTNTFENRNIREAANLPSPNYVYHLARTLSGFGCDAGSNIGRVVDVLKKGALSLADYPFTDTCVPPASPDLVARAHDFKVLGLSRVDISQPDDVKGQLARNNPVMISFKDSTAWQRFRGAGIFTESAPPPDDKVQGGHAMTIVGYDERRQAFRLINSWGKGWGDHGYAWFSYGLLQSRINGAWVLNMELGPQAVVPPGPQPSPQPQPQPGPTPTPAPGLQLTDLQSLSCSKVTLDQQSSQSVLSGYVASDDDLNKVRAIAANVPNVSLGDVIVAPWPQCEALQTLEKPLGVADRPAINIGPTAVLHEGDPLKIQVRSPSQISFLYVSYIQADGSVVHLVQPSGLVPQPTLPRQALEFGSGEGGKAKFTVSAPFGREMIIAIASRSPLFDHELPQHETERDYLSELRRALIYKPAPDMPDRELAATMTTLQTSAR
jgi:C1A family cysteine protease